MRTAIAIRRFMASLTRSRRTWVEWMAGSQTPCRFQSHARRDWKDSISAIARGGDGGRRRSTVQSNEGKDERINDRHARLYALPAASGGFEDLALRFGAVPASAGH